MVNAAQHAHPPEATAENRWTDPQGRSPQRQSETLEKQRIFPLAQVDKMTDAAVRRWVDRRSWKWNG